MLLQLQPSEGRRDLRTRTVTLQSALALHGPHPAATGTALARAMLMGPSAPIVPGVPCGSTL